MSEEIEKRMIPAAPIHPLSALATIALDGIFAVPELTATLAPIFLPVISIGVGLLGFAATSLVQRHVAKEEWGSAIAKGVVMGILAGVPYAIGGTTAGGVLLLWAGLHQFLRLPGSGNNELVDDAINRPRLDKGEE